MDAKELHNNLSQTVDANATSEPENNQSASGAIPVIVKTSVAEPEETATAETEPTETAAPMAAGTESTHDEPEVSQNEIEPAETAPAEIEAAPVTPAEVEPANAAPAVVPVRMAVAHEESATTPEQDAAQEAAMEAVSAAVAEVEHKTVEPDNAEHKDDVPASTPGLLQPEDHLSHKSKVPAFAAIAALVVLGAAGGGAAYYMNMQKNQTSVAVSTSKVSARSAASADAVPAGTMTPSPTPTATPTPTPSATPVPTAAPTAAPAKVVTVTNSGGLNFHSSMTAVRTNVVGWVPFGSKITVDSTTGTWSHGTSGKVTGYFLTSYTK